MEFIGYTIYGYPIYSVDEKVLVDTGCGIEHYDVEAYGEIEE